MSESREKLLSPKLAIQFAMKMNLLTAADGQQRRSSDSEPNSYGVRILLATLTLLPEPRQL